MPDAAFRHRRRSPLLLWGLALTGAMMAIAALAPALAPHDPAEQVDPAASARRPPGTVLAAVRLEDGTWRLADRVRRTPGGLLVLERRGRIEEIPLARVQNLDGDGVADRRVFPLGSDELGRDVLSRMLYGARVSLVLGVFSVALALTVGVAVGSAAALGGRWADMLLMRLVDALIAFPWLFLMLAVVALFRPGGPLLILLLGGTAWMGLSRLVRAELLSLAQREYVLAARATGLHPLLVLWRHLLPAALAPVLAQGALLVASVILAESALSFLGMGIQPPTPSWGNMVAEGQNDLTTTWWVATFPGLAIAVTVIAFNLLADGLRDTLDPRSHER